MKRSSKILATVLILFVGAILSGFLIAATGAKIIGIIAVAGMFAGIRYIWKKPTIE